MNNFTGKVVAASFFLSAFVTGALQRANDRRPAGLDEGFELTIQNVSTFQGGKIQKLNNAYLRAVFNNKESVVVQADKLNLVAGESKRLDVKLDIQNKWINQDGLEFRLELVQSGFFESVLLRCSTISKGLSVYNRAYTCTVPNEQNAIITYRVARKGAPLPDEAPQGLASAGQ